MTVEACQGKNTLRQSTKGDFFQTFDQQWAFPPRGISCHLAPCSTMSMSRFVCRVFVLWCQYASHLTCHVSSHRVHLSHTFYAVTYITSMHPYINTLMYSPIHAYIMHMHTQHQFAQGCISRPESCSAVPFRFGPHLSLCQATSSNKRTACSPHFHQKVSSPMCLIKRCH